MLSNIIAGKASLGQISTNGVELVSGTLPSPFLVMRWHGPIQSGQGFNLWCRDRGGLARYCQLLTLSGILYTTLIKVLSPLWDKI